MSVSDDRDDKWFLRASRERAEEAEMERTLEDITSAIGERRSRDLLDIVATVEQNKGWNTALEYLVAAADKKYSTPASFGKQRTQVEPLKYREMIFSLLSCDGLEPIQTDTIILLQMLKSKISLADASQSLILFAQKTAMKQIESGDTLYFNISPDEKFDELTRLLESTRTEKIANLILKLDDEQVDLTHLWYSEYGRLALSDVGIKGTKVSTEQLEMVLSVIQVSPEVKQGITTSETPEVSGTVVVRPSNQMYKELHEHIIDQDIEGIISKASTHSLLTLNAILDNAVTQYITSKSSEDYRKLLQCINGHVAVRHLNSIAHLEKLLRVDDQRIVTPAITALGNLYHESSAHAIVDLVCKTSDERIIKASVKALDNILKKSPETLVVIKDALESECKNRRNLRHFLRKEAME
ncbi:MAG: armadillo/beta-catenin-like repeat-containing protein [Candidatus Thorarchaeota archaeon]|jgi:hypothetical protein